MGCALFFTKNLFSTVKFDIGSLPSGLGVIDTIQPSPVPSVLDEALKYFSRTGPKQSIFVGVGLSKKALNQAEWC